MKVLVPLAEGFEEMEAITMIDVLRRARWDVVSVGFGTGPVTASRGVVLLPDCTWRDIDCDGFDMILLPGGMGGVRTLCGHEELLDALRRFDAKGKWIGAICAAALVLYRAGILHGREFTCYPGIEKEMGEGSILRSDDPVVVDGNLITSQGPGTAIDFSLKVVELGEGDRIAQTVREGLLKK